MSAKLRIVDLEADKTVMVEPTSSKWDIDDTVIRVLFWDENEWRRIPPSARPKNAQWHRGKGWVLVEAM